MTARRTKSRAADPPRDPRRLPGGGRVPSAQPARRRRSSTRLTRSKNIFNGSSPGTTLSGVSSVAVDQQSGDVYVVTTRTVSTSSNSTPRANPCRSPIRRRRHQRDQHGDQARRHLRLHDSRGRGRQLRRTAPGTHLPRLLLHRKPCLGLRTERRAGRRELPAARYAPKTWRSARSPGTSSDRHPSLSAPTNSIPKGSRPGKSST